MAHRRLRHILIAAEVALAFLLTLGTGLLLKSLHRVLDVDPGFRTHNLYISGYALIGSRYAKDDVVKQFERDALDHLRSIPGVDSISTVSTLPLNGGFDQRGLFIKERPLANDADGPSVDAYYIGTDYFRTMGIRLVRGRAFTTADGATPLAPVAIVSEKAARTFWPNQDPIGSHIQLGSHDETKPYATIVGIAADVLQYGLDSVPTPEAYALDTYEADTSPGIVLRSQLSPNALQKAIEQQIATLDKGAPVTDLVSMDHVVSKSLAQRKFLATLIGCFGFLALLLSVVGIYGVMAYQVAQRTNEIGIRMALGATPLAILRLVVREGMIWALSGVVAGAVASVALKQLLASQLFGIRTTDPITVALAAGVLGLCAFLACFIPARRATRVDPLVALRYM